MVQQVVITVTCDLPHDGDEVEAVETLSLSYKGRDLELDVCGRRSAQIREALGRFTTVARKVRGTRRDGRTVADREHSAEVRAWAAERGMAVNGRGRRSATVMAEYDAAQFSGPESGQERPGGRGGTPRQVEACRPCRRSPAAP